LQYFYLFQAISYISGISVQEKESIPGTRMRDKPAVQPDIIFGDEINVFIRKAYCGRKYFNPFLRKIYAFFLLEFQV
jgi:hypothetical protein